MQPYGKVKAIQEHRVSQFVSARERAEARRRASKNEPGGLSELLDSLARGLAGIGLGFGGGDKGHPASPAY